MIIVKLAGGLGNQMFQYAAARRLSFVHQTELKLDHSSLGKNPRSVTPREFELRHLNIAASTATPEEVARFLGSDYGGINGALTRLCRKIGLVKPNPHLFLEKHFHFDRALLDAPDDTYLDGYWQSEKYFDGIEDLLRRELTVRYPLSGKNRELAEHIKQAASVSIHVRRGDYYANPMIGRYHGVCGLDYYRKSIAVIRTIVSEPHFFIFSDEPEWAESNLKMPHPATIVKHNGPRKGHEDLRLMSLCRNNIIANSSFSWWGAWLNDNREKIVLAPEKWFHVGNIKTMDLVPDSWMKV